MSEQSQIPAAAQRAIEQLDDYQVVSMEWSKRYLADIIHLYPTDKYGAEGNGFYNMKLFRAVLYNTKTNQKFESHDWHDGVDLAFIGVKSVGIYADGSTIVVLKKPYPFSQTQCITFFES